MLFLALAVVLSGCGKSDVQVYQVPKEDKAPPTASAGLPHGHPEVSGAASKAQQPTLTWTVPQGWEQAPAGDMRLASFRVNGKNGKTADVSIIPLPGMAGGDLNNVNRWRGQVGLGPLTEADLATAGMSVQIEGQSAQMYDQAGENAGSGEKTRILGAILRREGVAWFFKMTGDDELVAQEKPAFVKLLESLKFNVAEQPGLPPSHPPVQAASTSPTAAPGSGQGSASSPEWQVPAGWQESAAGQFLAAKFVINAETNAQATVNVSVSSGDGGGWAGNVNRWRKQLGLGELADAELKNATTALETGAGRASVVDISGTDARSGQKARLIGAMVPRGSQTWFYKLMGNDRVVAREKDAFTRFIQTAKYPNAS
jgi:hypothetical protein